MSCAGCNFISEFPHTLRTGRVCCSTCFLVTEEAASIERHVLNLFRCNGVQARRHYIERVHAAEGEKVRIEVESEFLRQWKKAQGVT